MEWVIEDFTKSELQHSWWTGLLDIQKVLLQGSNSVPAESVLAIYRNVKVKIATFFFSGSVSLRESFSVFPPG